MVIKYNRTSTINQKGGRFELDKNKYDLTINDFGVSGKIPFKKREGGFQLIELVNKSTIDGVIVSNTSVDQEIKNAAKVGYLAGGVSGKLIGDKSNKVLSLFKEKLDPKKIIVAVGGVFDVDSYNKKIDLGADLVQIYTGFIYEGPSLIKRIVQHGK